MKGLLEAMGIGSLQDEEKFIKAMQLLTQTENCMETGLWLCRKVLEKASDMGFPVVTAACDAGGNLTAFLRADGAYIASIDIAINKAYTAAALQMPTEDLEKLAAPGGSLYGIQHSGRIVIFAGGIPLRENGRLIGGFGVSGGTAAQDKELAHYARELFASRD